MPTKSNLDVLVLAMLDQEPMHGYEITTKIKEQLYDVWVDVATSSIYNTLKKIENQGLAKTTEIRLGKQPPRTTFTITKKGKKYLNQKIPQILQQEPYFKSFMHAALMTLNKSNQKNIIQNLQQQKINTNALVDKIAEYHSKKKNNMAKAEQLIYEHLKCLYKAHITWLENTINDLENRK